MNKPGSFVYDDYELVEKLDLCDPYMGLSSITPALSFDWNEYHESSDSS
jgi:hypothetical protein